MTRLCLRRRRSTTVAGIRTRLATLSSSIVQVMESASASQAARSAGYKSRNSSMKSSFGCSTKEAAERSWKEAWTSLRTLRVSSRHGRGIKGPPSLPRRRECGSPSTVKTLASILQCLCCLVLLREVRDLKPWFWRIECSSGSHVILR